MQVLLFNTLHIKVLLNYFVYLPNTKCFIGHYIPQLAKLMVQINRKKEVFKLKGIAVSTRINCQKLAFNSQDQNSYQVKNMQLGNPVLEYATDFNSRAEFLWSHGLLSDTTYNMFTSVCNYSRYVSEYYRDAVSASCLNVMTRVNAETSKFVDKYDVTLDVCISSVLSQSKILNPQPQLAQVKERSVDVCVEDKVVSYLNRRDVQRALHARLLGVRRWDVCSK